MADEKKILKQLKKEFEYVNTYMINDNKVPAWFACNMNDTMFRVVSIYLDSEIGGFFILDEAAHMQHVYEHFDAIQAEDLIKIIIDKVNSGDALVLGNTKNEVIH